MSHVLCLDDDLPIAAMLGRLVQYMGHTPIICTNSFDAITHHRHGIAAAIVDYLMPRWDGVEVLAAVQDVNPACRRIILTAAPDEQPLQEALRTGIVHRIIAKPPTFQDLENALAWLPK